MRELLQGAEGVGALDGEGVRTGRAEHPVCGDIIQITFRVDDEQVMSDYAWQADGCPATIAVAAASYGAWLAKPVAEAKARLRRRLTSLGGLAPHEHHAEAMLLRALAAALGGADKPGSSGR